MAFLAAILPSLHLWGGNPEVVTVVLKRLFGYDVRLKENVRAETPIPEDIRYRLGSKAARLGVETVIGRSFEECDSRYVVEFVGVPPGKIRDFLPGGRTRRGAEAFLDYCMPGELDRAIAVTVEKRAARPGGERYLGYSTYL
jgi:predicted component of type VI protein secretion system